MADSLLGEARKAILAKDYERARDLYAKALAETERRSDLDLRMRYGWCAQKCGDIDEAARIYKEIEEEYLRMGEPAAAESLALMRAALKKPEKAREGEKVKQKAVIRPLSEAEMTEALWGMGEIRQLQPGDVLCRYGEQAHALWLLQYGTLRMELPGYDEPDYLRATDRAVMMVGELGVFTRQRRLATLIAETEVVVVEVSSADIYQRCAFDSAFAAGYEQLVRDRWVMPVLSQHRIFNRINEVDRRRLVDVFALEYHEPRRVLVEAGSEQDGCYLLRSGRLFYIHYEDHARVDQFESETGERVITVSPGEIVHLGGLLQGFASPYQIVCATPVQVLRLRQRQFKPFTLRRPWLLPAIKEIAEKPAHLQILRPNDDYLWSADRMLAFTGARKR